LLSLEIFPRGKRNAAGIFVSSSEAIARPSIAPIFRGTKQENENG
jgi:hypothetical protein